MLPWYVWEAVKLAWSSNQKWADPRLTAAPNPILHLNKAAQSFAEQSGMSSLNSVSSFLLRPLCHRCIIHTWLASELSSFSACGRSLCKFGTILQKKFYGCIFGFFWFFIWKSLFWWGKTEIFDHKSIRMPSFCKTFIICWSLFAE